MKYKKIIKNFLFLFLGVNSGFADAGGGFFSSIAKKGLEAGVESIIKRVIGFAFESTELQKRKYKDEAKRLYLKDIKIHQGRLFYDRETIKIAKWFREYMKKASSKDLFPGVLLFGPPGTGKTALAGNFIEFLKQEIGIKNVRVFTISAAELLRNENSIHHFVAIMDMLQESRSEGEIDVLWIDECELVLKYRDRSDTVSIQPKILATFLSAIQSGYNDFFLIASTNIPGQIDDAAFRRFAIAIPVLNPNPETAAKICLYFINENKRKTKLDQFAPKLIIDPRLDFAPTLQVFDHISSIEGLLDQEALEIAAMVALYNILLIIIQLNNISPADIENIVISLFNIAKVNTRFVGLNQLESAITKKSLQKTEMTNSKLPNIKNIMLEKKALIADEQTKNECFSLGGWDNLCVLNKNKDPELFLTDLFLQLLYCREEELEEFRMLTTHFCPFGPTKVEEILTRRKQKQELRKLESTIENLSSLFDDPKTAKFFMRDTVNKVQKQNTMTDIEFTRSLSVKCSLLKPRQKLSAIDLNKVKKDENGVDFIDNN